MASESSPVIIWSRDGACCPNSSIKKLNLSTKIHMNCPHSKIKSLRHKWVCYIELVWITSKQALRLKRSCISAMTVSNQALPSYLTKALILQFYRQSHNFHREQHHSIHSSPYKLHLAQISSHLVSPKEWIVSSLDKLKTPNVG